MITKRSKQQKSFTVPLATSPMKPDHFRARVRTVLAVAVLWASAPFLMLWALCAWLKHLLKGAPRIDTKAPRRLNILVTGGKMSKASAVARAVGREGHRVVTAEILPYRFCHTRFTRYASKHYVLPRPIAEPKKWLDTVQRIVRDERIDLVIPCTAPVESSAYAHLRKALPQHVRVFAFKASMSDKLDHKYTFNRLLVEAGVAHPETALMECTQDAVEFFAKHATPGKKYIVKPAVYDPEARTELLFLPLDKGAGQAERQRQYLSSRNASKTTPYVIQEILEEPELGCYSVFANGRLTGFTLFDSCASCLVYRPHPNKETYRNVMELVRNLGRALNLTGQFTLDLMHHPESGQLLPIECNPRIHSACCMMEGTGFGGIFSNPTGGDAETLDPNGSGVLRYWIMDQLFLRLGFWKHKDCIKLPLWDLMAKGSDALLHGDDPMPFLSMYLIQIPLLLLGELVAGTPWLKIDFCIGKIVKSGGD